MNGEKSLPTDTSIMTYGEEELQEVITYFSKTTEHQLQADRIMNDYLELKLLLKTKKDLTLQQTSTYILTHYTDQFPDFKPLCELVLVSPVTSAACERGFSMQNRIKTKLPSRLAPELVTKLMRIQEEGPELEDFPTTTCLQKFQAICNRRK